MFVIVLPYDAEAEEVVKIRRLPRPTQRWTVRRKAMVIQAVRGGCARIEEVCKLYNISADEFSAWQRDFDRYGVPGLRATRVQIYRMTEQRRCQRPQGSLGSPTVGHTDSGLRLAADAATGIQ